MRCRTPDASSLHAKVRPEAPFVARTFHTGSWLFGSQRANIARVFEALKWDAVPTQPIPGPHMGSTGIWWAATSTDGPPAPVLVTNQGEVLVVEQKPRAIPPISDPPVVATKAAMRRFVAQAEAPNEAEDPLQTHDHGGSTLMRK